MHTKKEHTTIQSLNQHSYFQKYHVCVWKDILYMYCTYGYTWMYEREYVENISVQWKTEKGFSVVWFGYFV